MNILPNSDILFPEQVQNEQFEMNQDDAPEHHVVVVTERIK